MTERFFDFEVLPHWWLCVFGDIENPVTEDAKKRFDIIHSDMPNARELLLNKLREQGFVNMGYNIKYYDLIIANAIYQGFSPEQIKIINDIIINPDLKYSTKEHTRLAPFANKRLSGIVYEDLLDDSDGTLKQKEAILGLNILESYVDFNKADLTQEDKDDLIYYCKQDVYASMVFYDKIVRPYCMTKLALGRRFNIDERTCYTSTNAKLVSLALGAVKQTFSDANKIEITLPSRIKQYCYDNVPFKVLEHILKSQEGLKTRIFNNDVDFGNGGLHSVYAKQLYVESNSEWILINIDAASYYPSEMIQFKTLSRTVQNPKVLEEIFDERMKLKHKANPTAEDTEIQKADKLVMNTTFGASGNKYLALYDPYQCTATCRIGQIFLTALACRLRNNINGFEVIQGNTDGLLCYFRRKDLQKVRMYMDEWMSISGIKLEEDEVKCIWQRDVNNYLMLDINGKMKLKGGWLNNTIYRKGTVKLSPLTGFVSANAAIKFLTQGINPIKTIINDRNIENFAIICTKGPTFSGVVQRFANGMEVPLFKANRVIATKDENAGKIYKYKTTEKGISYTQMANVPEHCLLVNEDLSTYNFEELRGQIDYMYYIQKTIDMLDIPWQELKDGRLISTNKFDFNI